MKRKILFVITLTILGLFAMQSCKKEAPVVQTLYVAAMPSAPEPAVDAIIPFTGTGQQIVLSWTGTATNAVTWDVYFGGTDAPDKVATVTANTYTATITTGGTYFWQLITQDAQGITTKSPVWSFEVNSNPAVPSTPKPALNATNVSNNPTILWSDTDPEGDALTYDLYLGTSATPAIYQAGLTDTSFAVVKTLTANTAYYWQVVAHDPYGGISTSPVWKFTTGALPIVTYTGNYTADEPAEAYTYDISFAFATASTITTANYWNSGWAATFTIDLTKLTYSMPLTVWGTYSGIEAGIVDPATGTMTGTYTIWHNTTIAEQGVHTYTKK
jgi:hypothetical protein